MAKQFSNKERDIIRYIYNNRQNNTFVLTNVFNRWFDRTGVSFNTDTGDIVYSIQNPTQIDAESILSDETGIIEVALLVKYLVDHEYIYLIKKEKEDLPQKLGGNWSNLTVTNTLPPDIVDIIRQTFRRIYVSHDLIQFVENGFKTYEDLQLIQASTSLEAARIQIKIGLASLFFSALALVCTLVIHIQSNCTQNKHNETILNTIAGFQANFCALNNKNTLELCAHIDSLGVSFNQYNTNNVNITKTTPKRVSAKKQYNLIQIDTISCDGKQYIV